jgi:hypothetical protein
MRTIEDNEVIYDRTIALEIRRGAARWMRWRAFVSLNS